MATDTNKSMLPIAAGLGILAANQPSRAPVSFGSVIGQGGLTAMQWLAQQQKLAAEKSKEAWRRQYQTEGLKYDKMRAEAAVKRADAATSKVTESKGVTPDGRLLLRRGEDFYLPSGKKWEGEVRPASEVETAESKRRLSLYEDSIRQREADRDLSERRLDLSERTLTQRQKEELRREAALRAEVTEDSARRLVTANPEMSTRLGMIAQALKAESSTLSSKAQKTAKIIRAWVKNEFPDQDLKAENVDELLAEMPLDDRIKRAVVSYVAGRTSSLDDRFRQSLIQDLLRHDEDLRKRAESTAEGYADIVDREGFTPEQLMKAYGLPEPPIIVQTPEELEALESGTEAYTPDGRRVRAP